MLPMARREASSQNPHSSYSGSTWLKNALTQVAPAASFAAYIFRPCPIGSLLRDTALFRGTVRAEDA